MALGDFPQSSVTEDDGDCTSASSYGNATTITAYLPQTLVLCNLRHHVSHAAASSQAPRWRLKERVSSLCLNIGVDPPDVINISLCAPMECWIDPFSMSPPRALESIAQNLSLQYERWLPRALYKVQLDPTKGDVRKLCLSCGKNAKTDRVLFHYNGHGVPLPLSELHSWLKTPSIYIFDCSAASPCFSLVLDVVLCLMLCM